MENPNRYSATRIGLSSHAPARVAAAVRGEPPPPRIVPKMRGMPGMIRPGATPGPWHDRKGRVLRCPLVTHHPGRRA